MEDKSFFEYIGIADMERIHSQVLAWIFSDNFKAIDSQERKKLLQNIFELDNASEIKNILTENNSIDIIIETENEILIIENKIKSSQHSNQLQRYEDFCNINYPNIVKKFYFLTLIDEESKNPNWKKISYSKIFNNLKTLRLNNENKDFVIFREYQNYIGKLANVYNHFKENTKYYDMVFLDGKKKKSEKINSQYENENYKFIAENQLETILQKSYLNKVSNQISNIESFVGETRGDALIDFKIKNQINFEGKFYSTIIQLQGNTIKFAFLIYGKEYIKSDKKWIEKIIPKMEKLSVENNFGYEKCNKPKSKAYISISKKVDKYWHMNNEDLSKFINEEIKNGEKMTEILIQELN